MNKVRNIGILVLSGIGLLSLYSCQAEMTPLQVSERFWQGIQANNLTSIKKYSLPESFEGNDNTDKLGEIRNIEFGRVVIDGEFAEIETTVTIIKKDNEDHITLSTYLESRKNNWFVNYAGTVQPLQVNQDMAELMEGIEELTEEFAEELEDSVGEFREKAIPEIKSRLEEVEQELREKIPELKNMIEEVLKDLEKSIEESFPPPEEPKTQET